MRILKPHLIGLFALLLSQMPLHAKESKSPFPKGLMLSLDFDHAENGLIPNKAAYPLTVPTGNLKIEMFSGEIMLALSPEQGLEVPHSVLLQPDGTHWQASVRVGARPNGGTGFIMSQTDGPYGYVVYLREGIVQVAVSTPGSFVILQQDPNTIRLDCRKQMVLVDLIITSSEAVLLLDRARVASAPLTAPLSGGEMPLRFGKQDKLPDFLKNMNITSSGIDGAVDIVRIWRK